MKLDPNMPHPFKEERERLRLTPQRLAELGGCGAQNIYNAERGRGNPGLTALVALARQGGDVGFVLTGKRDSGTRIQQFLNRVHLSANRARRSVPNSRLFSELLQSTGRLHGALLQDPWGEVVQGAHALCGLAAIIALDGDKSFQYSRQATGADAQERMPGTAGRAAAS